MRVFVVYESLYGSNRRIAEAVAAGIGGDAAATTVVEAKDAPAAIDADLVVFDRSGPTIAGRLRRAGGRLVGKPAKFYSADGVGALVAGEEERARAWGAELVDLVRRA